MKGAGEMTTIHQTLTPDASSILTRSVADASRRSHSHTTPLHVAATLLSSSSPSSLLRQACLLSHPTTTNPLHSRAIDLCFSVALDRLPSTTTTTTTHPPPSNALSAALKRAQAHQRRSNPDQQQQQPLLAVRIELDQLVVSILDDPGVSRVMREASFSSPAVKAYIEHSTSTTTTNQNHYQNPRLAAAGSSDVNRVLDILSRPKKRNPVLVGDSNPGAVMHDVLRRITAADAPAHLRAARVVPLGDKSQIRDLETRILDAARRGGGGGVVLDMGDLKWLVEAQANMSVCQIQEESGRAAVAEISLLLARLREAIGGERLWVVGTATCATYLRCQVYYPTMESEWDLQAMPIAPPRSFQFSGGPTLPRQGGAGILINSVESLTPSRGFPLVQPQAQSSLCAACTQSYKFEVVNLRPEAHTKDLPQWLRIATPVGAEPKTDQLQNKEQELLMKKWIDNCSRLHLNPSSAMLNSLNVSSLGLQTIQPRSSIAQSITTHRSLNASLHARRPASPVKTDLVLGPSKKSSDRNAGFVDSDSVKKLFHGLSEQVSWQLEAAAAVAAAMIQCTSGTRKRRGVGPNSDSWLLFIGPDRVGKRRMASAISELLFGTKQATIICLGGTPGIIDGDDGESDVKLRGKTPLDRVAEAVRQNPVSVIVLEDVNKADVLVLKAIKLAIEKGRLTDSHRREVGLGSVVFVLMADWLPDDLKDSQSSLLRREEKILSATQIGRPLKLFIEEKSGKRRAEWLLPEEMRTKDSCRLGISLDLNLAVGWDEDTGEGSSDLTVEHEQEQQCGRLAVNQPAALPSLPSELIDSVDETIVFKPVDFNPLRRRIRDNINSIFTATMGGNRSIRIDDDVLDQLAGGVWLGGPAAEFENWMDRVLLPAIQRLKSNAKVGEGAAARLTAVNGSGRMAVAEGWMPSTVTVAGTQ